MNAWQGQHEFPRMKSTMYVVRWYFSECWCLDASRGGVMLDSCLVADVVMSGMR